MRITANEFRLVRSHSNICVYQTIVLLSQSIFKITAVQKFKVCRNSNSRNLKNYNFCIKILVLYVIIINIAISCFPVHTRCSPLPRGLRTLPSSPSGSVSRWLSTRWRSYRLSTRWRSYRLSPWRLRRSSVLRLRSVPGLLVCQHLPSWLPELLQTSWLLRECTIFRS